MSELNMDTYKLKQLAYRIKSEVNNKLNVTVSVFVYKRRDIEDTYSILVYIPNSQDDIFRNVIENICTDLLTFVDNPDIIINIDVV